MTVSLRRTAFGGGVWFERGPLVYSYAIPARYQKDTTRYANMNGKYPADDEAFPCWDMRPCGPWNFAVAADVEATVIPCLDTAATPGPDRTSCLIIPVYPIDWDFDKGPQGELLTPDLPVCPSPTGPMQYIDLSPYGRTTVRLTVFPVLSSPPS